MVSALGINIALVIIIIEGVAEVWKEVNTCFLSSMNEALACDWWLYVMHTAVPFQN